MGTVLFIRKDTLTLLLQFLCNNNMGGETAMNMTFHPFQTMTSLVTNCIFGVHIFLTEGGQ